ncbi:MAG TPA: hypothetical protein VIH43_01295 [Chthoniobacterales bacterium]
MQQRANHTIISSCPIGFQARKAGTQFIHPNMLVLLDSTLRVGK